MLNTQDPKIKHISGQYVVMPNAPEPDDILYYCFIKKRKQFKVEDLVKHFGESKMEIIKESLKQLDFDNSIQLIGEDTYKVTT